MAADDTRPTRRSLLAAAAAAPLAAVPAAVQATPAGAPGADPDAALIAMAAEVLRLRAASWSLCRPFTAIADDDPLYTDPATGFNAMRARVQPWEDRCDELTGLVLDTPARTLHGIAAKAALLRDGMDIALDGGPMEGARDSDWLGWSIGDDLAAMPELPPALRALILAAGTL